MFYLLQNYHSSYDLRRAVGHPYGSQFSLGTSWRSGFSFHGPSKTSTCSSLQHFSLLQWRALVEHHCRQSSFRIVSHFQLHVPFHQFNQCWFPYLKYLLLWDLRGILRGQLKSGKIWDVACVLMWMMNGFQAQRGKSPSDQIKIFGVHSNQTVFAFQRHLE